MNRREFTASFAALAASPLIPFQAMAATPAAAVPPGAYAWAQLIARAQNRCSPAMLARQLRLAPEAAEALFNEMLRDGVLRAPGAAGMAQAVKPIDATGTKSNLTKRLGKKLRAMAEDRIQQDDAAPLVKEPASGLGCAEPQTEEAEHASPAEPFQESPERG